MVSTKCSLWICSFVFGRSKANSLFGCGSFSDLSAGGGLTDVPVLLPIVLRLSLQTWLNTLTHKHTLMQTYTCILISTSFLKSLKSCTRATNTNTHPPTQAAESTHDCQPVSHIICQLSPMIPRLSHMISHRPVCALRTSDKNADTQSNT